MTGFMTYPTVDEIVSDIFTGEVHDPPAGRETASAQVPET